MPKTTYLITKFLKNAQKGNFFAPCIQKYLAFKTPTSQPFLVLHIEKISTGSVKREFFRSTQGWIILLLLRLTYFEYFSPNIFFRFCNTNTTFANLRSEQKAKTTPIFFPPHATLLRLQNWESAQNVKTKRCIFWFGNVIC